MSEQTVSPTSSLATWGVDLQTAVCEHCHWSYLVPCDSPMPRCPNCYRGDLSAVDAFSQAFLPELVLPIQVGETTLEDAIRDFASDIPFAPAELTPANLRTRLKVVYLPVWLVDADVSAQWQMEAGYQYEVVSHQENYSQNSNGWESKEVKEDRVHWENRVGLLRRSYQNVPAPALDDAPRLNKAFGAFDLKSAQPYQPEMIERSLVRLPDHLPKEAWSEAAAAFHKAAAEECQTACAANQQRQYRWKAQFSSLHWTLLLQPIYSTCYRDDEGRWQPVFIHGQRWQVSGVRRASLRRASHASWLILAIGVALLMLGLLLEAIFQDGNSLTTFLAVGGVGGILGAAVPYLRAWDFNRQQALEERILQK